MGDYRKKLNTGDMSAELRVRPKVFKDNLNFCCVIYPTKPFDGSIFFSRSAAELHQSVSLELLLLFIFLLNFPLAFNDEFCSFNVE
jgi:hypothetical protein